MNSYQKIEKSFEKKFIKKRLIKKPEAKVKSVNPTKFVTKGLVKQQLVTKGRTGYFNKEMMEEAKWLS